MTSSDAPLVSNQISDFDTPENYEDFSEIFERENKRVVDAVNSKVTGLYPLNETATFEQYFTENDPQSYRNVYRKVVNFGALPNNAEKRVAHSLTLDPNTKMVRMYGAATDPAGLQYIPLPFSSPTLANNVTLEADANEVLITTGTDFTNFTNVTVVMEYTKSS